MNLPPPPDIFESLRYFRAHSMFCDVRLRFPDSLEFFVHRVVLAAASSYFRDRLTKPDGIQVGERPRVLIRLKFKSIDVFIQRTLPLIR